MGKSKEALKLISEVEHGLNHVLIEEADLGRLSVNVMKGEAAIRIKFDANDDIVKQLKDLSRGLVHVMIFNPQLEIGR